MILIGNNCLSGLFYQFHAIQYNQPFMWCVTPYDSFEKLLNSYDSLNWFNVNMRESTIKPSTYILTIDNTIDLHFVHYWFNTKTVYGTTTHDIAMPNIWEYIIEKYFVRIKRMLRSKEEPCFLINEESYGNQSQDTLLRIAKNEYKYRLLIVSSNRDINQYVSDRTSYIWKDPALTIYELYHKHSGAIEQFTRLNLVQT